MVLAGHHDDLDRAVAVKVLTTAATGAEAIAEFQAEARVLSKLDHPHIVRTHDYVGHGELCLLVMEMLGGGTLTRRQLSQEGVCAVGLAIAEALHHAHSMGVLHRDVKPANIMFTADGLPKIADFGIAKIFEGTASTASRIIGTPRYMAPEQITGDRLGPATDVYALAVVLYERLVGAPLFAANLPLPQLARHHREVVPPPPAGVPDPVAQVLMRALAKDPDDRHPTAHDFAVDLSRAATAGYGRGWIARSGVPVQLSDDVRNPPRRQRRRRSRPAGVGGVGVGGVGGVGPRRFFHSRARVATAAAVVAVVAAATGGTVFAVASNSTTAPSPPPPPPAWHPSPQLKPGFITIVAGTGADGYSGDGGQAIQAEFSGPDGITIDNFGNLYVTDEQNNRIRRVDPSGTITTVAGSGEVGFAGDDGPATEAALDQPNDVAVDGDGNIYISDSGNQRIRRVDTRGVITTVVGTGRSGFSGDNEPDARGFAGDNVPATEANLQNPACLTVDAAGNIYVCDGDNNRIRKIDTSGTITTIAGYGVRTYSRDGVLATETEIGYPSSMVMDGDGNIYFHDGFNYRIRRIDTNGIITTVAGTGEEGYGGDGGPATEAQIGFTGGLALDSAGNLYLADASNGRVRRVDTDGIITTIAGTDVTLEYGNSRPAAESGLAYPTDVAVDSDGNIYIADSNDNRIRAIRAGEPE